MSNKPWRNAEMVEDRVGPRGGKYWALTLDCGHKEFRSKLEYRLQFPIMIVMGKRESVLPLTPPYRVRCSTCGIAADK